MDPASFLSNTIVNNTFPAHGHADSPESTVGKESCHNSPSEYQSRVNQVTERQICVNEGCVKQNVSGITIDSELVSKQSIIKYISLNK